MNEETLQYHLQLRTGDVGRYVMLPGDPGRVPLIASFLDEAEEVAFNRELRTFTGTLDGERVSITSTGIGGPSTAIAVEELARIGADTFIRVGTSGLMQPDFMRSGDLVVVTGAVRDEGTTREYMPLAFPALADLDVVACLRQGCRDRGVRHHTGLSHTQDSFFAGMRTAEMPLSAKLQAEQRAWTAGGVLCWEMEAASLYVLSRVLGTRAGGIMLALADDRHGPENLCETAIAGLRRLIELDRQVENASEGTE